MTIIRDIKEVKKIQYVNENKESVYINNDMATIYPITNSVVQKWMNKNKKISDPTLKEETYVEKRAKAYPPITEQLDAMLKYFSSKRMKGENLPSDLDKVVGSWLNVKRKYPKNKEE